jgi:hypothetical protein
VGGVELIRTAMLVRKKETKRMKREMEMHKENRLRQEKLWIGQDDGSTKGVHGSHESKSEASQCQDGKECLTARRSFCTNGGRTTAVN